MEIFQAITNMTAVGLAQHMVNGISLGSLYALIAIGYTMVYGILLMINFAHADIVMMACYFALFGITTFHIPWYLTFVLTIALTALLGYLCIYRQAPSFSGYPVPVQHDFRGRGTDSGHLSVYSHRYGHLPDGFAAHR